MSLARKISMYGETGKIVAGETCGLIQRTEAMPEDSVATCARCRFRVYRRCPNSRLRTLTFSLAALILYFPSNFYPIITAEYHGLHSVFQDINGLASKKRTVKPGHFVNCLGVQSQLENGSQAHYGCVGGYRTFRCNRRFACEPGREYRRSSGKPSPV